MTKLDPFKFTRLSLVGYTTVLSLAFAFLPAFAAENTAQQGEKIDKQLVEVAQFKHQVTGVTVSENGRIFVNFPRWTEDVPVSVAEVMKDGSLKPYPNDTWNSWRNVNANQLPPQDRFVCVQSVVADKRGSLWIVDPAAPNSEKTIKGGPKLVQVDLKSDTVKQVFAIPPDVAGPASYLNDIRIAPDGAFAYMTDSGMPGGIVVVDLKSGKSWRALSDHPSTQAEPTVVVKTDGKPLRRPDGRQPVFNADSIEMSPDGQYLIWQALTGQTLYRISTEDLRKAADPDFAKTLTPEVYAKNEPNDGLWMDKEGRLYVSALQDNAVKRIDSELKKETLIVDSRLRWPDTFSQGPDGSIYVTASHIQDSPWFHPEGWTNNRFTLFKFRPPE
jgi:sugar lactone lactonase YvrE